MTGAPLRGFLGEKSLPGYKRGRGYAAADGAFSHIQMVPYGSRSAATPLVASQNPIGQAA